MSQEKFVQAGFNMNGLASASMHILNGNLTNKLTSLKTIDEKESFFKDLESDLYSCLGNINLGPISNPVEGIDYLFKDRESWISPLTLLTDFLLIKIVCSKFDNVKNLTSELKESLLIKSKIKITLQVNEAAYYAGFTFLFSHKPLCAAIINSFYENIENCEDVLMSHKERMSVDTINTVISSNSVKTELRKIATVLKSHSKEIGKSLNTVNEIVEINSLEKA